MTERAALSQGFLDRAGWGRARRGFLAGDASDRSYDRLWLDGKTAVLMDAPPGKGDDPADFMRIAAHLRGIGLSAPEVFDADLTHGFLLLEDLGDDLFATVLTRSPQREAALYEGATDVLCHLHRNDPPKGLANLSAADWAEAAGFALDWYAGAKAAVAPALRRDFVACLTADMLAHADGPRVMILRDYHAQNLLDLPGRAGLRRVGLLDFQLAQLAQPGYDLISLLQDARRDVSPAVAAAMVARFAKNRGQTVDQIAPALATLGAQRALRILGIFARLCMVGGKLGYVDLIPRVWGQLQENLAHPALTDLKRICAEALPPPDLPHLNRIKEKCATISR